MCRWLTYRGPEKYLEDLLYKPEHSLIDQSLHASEGKTVTNGDGFGVGWYGARKRPGTYHEVLPAWSDANLRSLAHQICADSFFAHVRASTGTATSRANCHPFTHDRWMFMHNGQVGDYQRLRRALENLLPDDLYNHRIGTTDSEVIFLLALANGLAQDPVAAMTRSIEQVMEVMQAKKARGPFRMTAPVTDGQRFYAFRFSSDDQPPSLYFASDAESLTVVSEPLDEEDASGWCEIPPNSVLVSERPGEIEIHSLAV